MQQLWEAGKGARERSLVNHQLYTSKCASNPLALMHGFIHQKSKEELDLAAFNHSLKQEVLLMPTGTHHSCFSLFISIQSPYNLITWFSDDPLILNIYTQNTYFMSEARHATFIIQATRCMHERDWNTISIFFGTSPRAAAVNTEENVLLKLCHCEWFYVQWMFGYGVPWSTHLMDLSNGGKTGLICRLYLKNPSKWDGFYHSSEWIHNYS